MVMDRKYVGVKHTSIVIEIKKSVILIQFNDIILYQKANVKFF